MAAAYQISVATCAKKRARGNYFASNKQAKRSAAAKRKLLGLNVQWFRCPHCHAYHIGKPLHHGGQA